MDSRTGKRINLGRLLPPPARRGIIVAASHGVQSGPPRGMRSTAEITDVFRRLVAADGVMVAPGILPLVEQTYVGRGAPALVIHLDWKNTTRTVYAPNTSGRGEAVVASLAEVAQAAAAGAAGVMTYLHVGQLDTALERREIKRNARVARECDRLGIVHIIEPRSAREHADGDQAVGAEVMSFICRLAAELGADVVKSVWPGSAESMAAIVETCPVPILLAGGAGDDPQETVGLARAAVAAGVAGFMFGRRITAATDPTAVLVRLRTVLDSAPAPAADSSTQED